MATLTAATFARNPVSLIGGQTITVFGSYNATAALEASAQTILLHKIPNGATIVDFREHHTTGATSCPMDVGIDSSLSAFSSQGTQAVVNRLSVGANLNYTVSLSASAQAANYAILKATPVLASSTTSFKMSWSLSYVTP